MMGIQSLLRDLGTVVPPWVVATLMVVGAVLYVPTWLRGVKEKQIRGLIRRCVSADREARRALGDEALARAGDDDILVEICAREALRRDQREIAEAALTRLTALGRAERVRLIRGEPLSARGPAIELEIVAVSTMLDERVWGLAEARLDQLAARAPGHPEVLELRARLQAGRDAEASTEAAASG